MAGVALIVGLAAAAAPSAPNSVHMNQLGFLPGANVRAIVDDPSSEPLGWRLAPGIVSDGRRDTQIPIFACPASTADVGVTEAEDLSSGVIPTGCSI